MNSNKYYIISSFIFYNIYSYSYVITFTVYQMCHKGCVNEHRKVSINYNPLYFFLSIIAALFHIFEAFRLWDQLYREKKYILK